MTPSDHASAMGAPTELDHCPLMPTYAPPQVEFVRGDGTILWDRDGKRYLDFLTGLAVVSVGHANPEVADAINEQARTLTHVSNLFGTDVGWRVAETLDRLLGGGGQIFFSNSGAEANECAIKLARKWGGRGKHVIVSAYRSFHGRTLATLHATGQPEKHEAFQPLPEGFRHVVYDDVDELAKAIDPSVAAILLEPIQGEGGVNTTSVDYLAEVRRLCDERGVLLILDEVQTGLGRTGAWFAHQHVGIVPDIVTIAKALGNGMPIGACWARREIAASFAPGDHGSTFGGQPLAASAALATLRIMERDDLPARAAKVGEYFQRELAELPGVSEVRGMGLLLAIELEPGFDAKAVQATALANGLVTNAVTPTAVRFAPPLTVSGTEVDEALVILRSALDAHRPTGDL